MPALLTGWSVTFPHPERKGKTAHGEVLALDHDRSGWWFLVRRPSGGLESVSATSPRTKLVRVAAVILVLATLSVGCASLRSVIDAAAPPNPALQLEGRVAQIGIRIVSAIRIAQSGVPTLVRTQVLTPEEGLRVLEGFRSMLEIAGKLGQALQAADTARDLVDAARHWDTVTAAVSELLRSGFALGNDVAGGAGRVAVSGLLGGMGDRLSELMAVAPARTGGQ